jgi:hypothetical protein
VSVEKLLSVLINLSRGCSVEQRICGLSGGVIIFIRITNCSGLCGNDPGSVEIELPIKMCVVVFVRMMMIMVIIVIIICIMILIIIMARIII